MLTVYFCSLWGFYGVNERFSQGNSSKNGRLRRQHNVAQIQPIMDYNRTRCGLDHNALMTELEVEPRFKVAAQHCLHFENFSEIDLWFVWLSVSQVVLTFLCKNHS